MPANRRPFESRVGGAKESKDANHRSRDNDTVWRRKRPVKPRLLLDTPPLPRPCRGRYGGATLPDFQFKVLNRPGFCFQEATSSGEPGCLALPAPVWELRPTIIAQEAGAPSASPTRAPAALSKQFSRCPDRGVFNMSQDVAPHSKRLRVR